MCVRALQIFKKNKKKINDQNTAPPVGSAWNMAQLCWGTGPNPDWVFAPATTWKQNGYLSIVGDTILPYATVGSYFNVTGVQVEKGNLATPFEFRPFAVELQLCQRYYYTSANLT